MKPEPRIVPTSPAPCALEPPSPAESGHRPPSIVPGPPYYAEADSEPLWSELRPIVQILDGLIGDDEGMRAVWDNWLTDFNENSPCNRSEESGKLPE